ncbi:GAF domain-containing sensor histidine kinase [Peribacillus cavernae]|uniref:histidine kinase n=1 Tax=Peribacillus cavernae TaxID=1674310 RepID=A0A3S0VI15_9BACI|nr:GAF domain-containing sensor histidine kinase [Peribacillus cavernae]MDQ0218327.1 two-component system NtrC family sensor kinase [Peribacillus cavernae]RUQ28393.1 GAF domain-containing sensor histidine kinase [Peribacillus cavernae]
MQTEKDNLIEMLTGIKSSKKNYYTELKKTVEQLEKKNMQLEIMNDITKTIKIDMNLEEIVTYVMEKLRLLMAFDDCRLYLLQKGDPVLVQVYPTSTANTEYRIKNADSSLFWSALTEKKVMQEQISTETTMFAEEDWLISQELLSILVMPLYSINEGIGVLTFGRKEQSGWTTEELEFLEQLTNHVAIILENSQLYNAVLQGKQEWEDTFKAVDDMIMVFDKNLEVFKFNDSAREFLDIYHSSSFYSSLGQTCKAIVQETFNSNTAGFQEIHSKNHVIYEMHTYPVLDNDQQVYGVIAYFKDVTKKRQMEVQLLHSGKLAAIGEMAAGIAHELNSPLTAILGNSQLLIRNTPETDRDYILLNDIKNCGNRCKQIIKSLLTFSRQDEYLFTSYSVNECVRQVLNLLTFQLEKNRISISLSLQQDLPLLDGSQPQIEQVIINLLLNAKDAVEMAKTSHKCISIQTSLEEDCIHVAVEDNGIGIEEARLPLVFHPFHTTKDMEKGTGLGLSVSLGIAKAHGGTIKVISSQGKGSTFILKLPLPDSGKNEVTR